MSTTYRLTAHFQVTADDVADAEMQMRDVLDSPYLTAWTTEPEWEEEAAERRMGA